MTPSNGAARLLTSKVRPQRLQVVVGPTIARTLIAELPELGTLDRRQVGGGPLLALPREGAGLGIGERADLGSGCRNEAITAASTGSVLS
jgi:hypothetical protein